MSKFRKVFKEVETQDKTFSFEEVQTFLIVLADRVYQSIDDTEFEDVSSCFEQTLKEIKESKV